MMALAGLAVAVIVTDLSLPDIFACILAFVPTGWGILSVSLSTCVIILQGGNFDPPDQLVMSDPRLFGQLSLVRKIGI